ncbi:MAG: acyloxyacyl hydrolase [Chlorobium sp.]|jgi:lipid A 3-O-deacylase|uniref:acyloxyacyl hydrolase n=1 Tax=Chlorobium sp. TaxID=1095 RepID=UPI001D1FAFAB|nr:acyloxyacyl hydrolase [Chlorobium sp.]MBN1278753.1 acyloxyacyl hydrolase [Chlorobiaceae bacterium]MCF8215596.1 acyloxyacyl hydrolase [Chlorobium sp.]MCF8270350.1 acyloxyacyl hydrolase [Chlorobium sp.]MCF8286719.1 acyloxyacyl hydrolase [Chlorobium sp.]MCF8290241.1 acyloxyacyl hydrolase [Chlorobium sp.]
MKHRSTFLFPLFFVVFFAIFLSCSHAAAETMYDELEPDIYLNEIGIGSGYAWGSLKGDDEEMSIYPAFVRIGFNANGLFGIKSRKSSLQLTIEPFVNIVCGSEDGVEAGCGFGMRYLHEVGSPVDLFVEASAAPMYYSIDTREQGKAGFNFLDQFGAGLQYRFAPGKAFFAGYRFRHISHAGVADRSNDGINTNAIIAGFSWLY